MGGQMGAMSRVSWPGCMPNALGTHLQVTAAAVTAMQETAFECHVSPSEAYSHDLHILDSMKESLQVTCMTIDDWTPGSDVKPSLESCYYEAAGQNSGPASA